MENEPVSGVSREYFATLQQENFDLKRQLAASANLYGSALETIEALQQENERLKAELTTTHSKHPEDSCYDAMPKLRAELQQAREEIGKWEAHGKLQAENQRLLCEALETAKQRLETLYKLGS